MIGRLYISTHPHCVKLLSYWRTIPYNKFTKDTITMPGVGNQKAGVMTPGVRTKRDALDFSPRVSLLFQPDCFGKVIGDGTIAGNLLRLSFGLLRRLARAITRNKPEALCRAHTATSGLYSLRAYLLRSPKDLTSYVSYSSRQPGIAGTDRSLGTGSSSCLGAMPLLSYSHRAIS